MFVRRVFTNALVLLFTAMFILSGIRDTMAQVYPGESIALTARKVPFEVSAAPKVAFYRFNVAMHFYTDEQSFVRNIWLTKSCEENRTIIDLPEFNKEYSWNVSYHDKKGKLIRSGPINHFRVVSPDGDTVSRYRVRVIDNNYADSGLLFFLDYTGALYNLKGEAVWYLPNTIPGANNTEGISDMKLSPFNTITFIVDKKGYETDYAGRVLWESPAIVNAGYPGKSIQYHHDFKRLQSGNYMILSSELASRILPDAARTDPFGDHIVRGIEFGSIVEFDAAGKQIWRWNASEHFTDEDIFSEESLANGSLRTHLNAFHFDEEKKIVYAGFRDISRIIKIKYPEKTILANYSGKNKQSGNKFFSLQHSIGRERNGGLWVFSNNTAKLPAGNLQSLPAKGGHADSVARLVLLRELHRDSSYEKLWDFECVIDGEAPPTTKRGGNITELGDDLFVCMGESPRIFVVNKKKELLFNAVVERWNVDLKMWVPFPQYRAFPVSRAQAEELIYNSIPKSIN